MERERREGEMEREIEVIRDEIMMAKLDRFNYYGYE